MLDFIEKIMSIDVWLYYLNFIFKVLFPSFVLLLLLSLSKLKRFNFNSKILFLIVTLTVIFGIRTIIFLGGLSYDSSRYLYPLMVFLLIPASIGGYCFINFTKKILSKNIGVNSTKYAIIIFIVLFSSISIGKVFRVRKRKQYIYNAVKIIKESSNKHSRIFIISDISDGRIFCLTNAVHIKYKNGDKLNDFRQYTGDNIYFYLTDENNKKIKDKKTLRLLKTYNNKTKYFLYKTCHRNIH